MRVFRRAAPCLVLIDEWVAYARQLFSRDDLTAGTFDTHFSFAQALTESAKAVDGVLVVVSIPASEGRADPDQAGEATSVEGSDVEVGGVGGREALRRLRNVIGRVESSWRPASAVESFEIVRRRLFNELDPARLAGRDATARVFGDLYRAQAPEFPAECREPGYAERIKAAYPIHPELFARLYQDWSTLDRFQRTRGVLRLMAAVIHALWPAATAMRLEFAVQRSAERWQGGGERLGQHWCPGGVGQRHEAAALTGEGEADLGGVDRGSARRGCRRPRRWRCRRGPAGPRCRAGAVAAESGVPDRQP